MPVKKKSKGTQRRPPRVKDGIIKKVKIGGKNYDEHKFLMLHSSESTERFEEVGELVKKKRLKWVSYDSELQMHYYLKL